MDAFILHNLALSLRTARLLLVLMDVSFGTHTSLLVWLSESVFTAKVSHRYYL